METKKERFTVETEDYIIKDYHTNKENVNGDLYLMIETIVQSKTGELVGRCIREFWTDNRHERFTGKDFMHESTAIFKDDIGYFCATPKGHF